METARHNLCSPCMADSVEPGRVVNSDLTAAMTAFHQRVTDFSLNKYEFMGKN